MGGIVKDLQSKAELDNLRSSGAPIILHFWAAWCEASNHMDQVFSHLSTDFPSAHFLRVEAEEQPEISEKYLVSAVPYFVFFKDGEKIDTLEGADASSLANKVAKVAGSVNPGEAAAPASLGMAAGASVLETVKALGKENGSSQAVNQVQPGGGDALVKRLQQLVNSHSIMLFMKGTPEAPRCGFSQKVVGILKDENVEFGSFDILSDNEVCEGLKKFSNWPTFPQLYCKGELLGGCDIAISMHESGELKEVFRDHGIKTMVSEKTELSEDGGGKSSIAESNGLSSALNSRLRSLINSNPVMLFMKGKPEEPKCGFSGKVVEILKEEKVNFESFDILSDEEVRQGLKVYSNWSSYPQLYVEGELIGGSDIVLEMQKSGELKRVLIEKGIIQKETLEDRLKALVASSPVMLFMKGSPDAPSYMETSNLNIRYDDSNEKALNGLFEAFGSTFSIQDITSAYHKADKNADLAGEMLFEMHGRTSTSLELASSGKPIFVESSRPSYDNAFGKSHQMNKNFRAPKQKWRPVSGGIVSSIIGKDYVKPIPIASGHMRTKPTKLDTKILPASVLWGKEAGLNLSKNVQMRKDIEDFLFRMLGDGFQLEKDVIQQVLDNCGYDMQKSMEKLLDLPAVNMDQGDKCLAKSTEKTLEVHSNSEYPATQKLVPPMSSNGGGANGVSNLNAKGVPQQEKTNDLQKEVLNALFNAVDESEVSRRRARAGRRSRALGELVVGPPQDFASERKTESVVSKQENNDDENDEEDAYERLRTAVKEYRATMKEYYKAAVAAFAKGDHDLANKLMDQGQFFRDKAQKADEESHQRIFETKNVDTQDEVTLDLHDHGAREAYRLLKHHLSLFSGIASIKYLRVITETDEVDTSKGARRRLVMKLLEKESIEWNEGENAGTILIRLDNINRKALSFAKA